LSQFPLKARYAAEFVSIALIYYVLAKLGLQVASIHPSASPVWPPSGFALAMVMLRGNRVWPAIFLAALAANATTAGTIVTSLAIASGNTLEAVVGGALIASRCGGTRAFTTPINTAKFALISIGLATPISAAIGVSALHFGGFAGPGQAGAVWLTWWIGDFVSVLLITPVIVLWARSRRRSPSRGELAELAMLAIATLAIGLAVFSPMFLPGAIKAPMNFLGMLPLLWAALRRGQRDTATVGLVLASFAIWGAAAGPDQSQRLGMNEAFLLVSMFVIGAAFPSLVLSAGVALRRQVEERLRESEERYRGIFEHAGTGIAIMNLKGQFESCNPAFSAMVGYSEAELCKLNAADLMHHEDRQTDWYQFNMLVRRRIPSYELLNRCVGKYGKPIWVTKYLTLLRDTAGTPTKVIALVNDMNDRKRHEEHIRLLMREVNHRTKNTFALVLAVARQIVSENSEDFIERFSERLQALSASQDLLIANEWKGVDIEELIRSQLAHFEDQIGRRIELNGSSLAISASAAQTIGMALHELATNAGKYGALSNVQGRVEVAWSRKHTGNGEETFTLSWRERGGPPVTEPSKTGFGTTVISRMAIDRFDAKVDLDFAATGLRWSLECNAKDVEERSSHVRRFKNARTTA
jgi:PAS domain S-box-containing protein